MTIPTARLLLIALLLVSATASAQEPPARATLLASVDAITPGASFTLGLRLKVKPQWHTYWINPGDSGEPTTVKLSAPPGFAFGEIQWPIPTRIEVPGGVTFGYEDEVLLLIPVIVDKPVAAGGNATIVADARWLCCKDVTCIEGRDKLEITLPLAAESKPANAELFKAWQQRLPALPKNFPAIDKAEQTPDGTVMIQWKQAPRNIEWFPITTSAFTIAGQDLRTDGAKTTLRFRHKVFKQPAPTMLDSVITYTDADGQRRGMSIRVYLPPAK